MDTQRAPTEFELTREQRFLTLFTVEELNDRRER
jgi:hypothetical protein